MIRDEEQVLLSRMSGGSSRVPPPKVRTKWIAANLARFIFDPVLTSHRDLSPDEPYQWCGFLTLPSALLGLPEGPGILKSLSASQPPSSSPRLPEYLF